jgi:hypothetical protein
MGGNRLAMSGKKDKKGKTLFSTSIFSEQELQTATEIIDIIDDLMFTNHPKIKFEHIILWWLSCEPAEA